MQTMSIQYTAHSSPANYFSGATLTICHALPPQWTKRLSSASKNGKRSGELHLLLRIPNTHSCALSDQMAAQPPFWTSSHHCRKVRSCQCSKYRSNNYILTHVLRIMCKPSQIDLHFKSSIINCSAMALAVIIQNQYCMFAWTNYLTEQQARTYMIPFAQDVQLLLPPGATTHLHSSWQHSHPQSLIPSICSPYHQTSKLRSCDGQPFWTQSTMVNECLSCAWY